MARWRPLWSSGDQTLTFDGEKGSAVVFENEAAFGQTAGTISLWFNADDLDGNKGILSRDASFNALDGHLTIRQKGNDLWVRLQNEDGSETVEVDDAVTEGTWHNVAVSFGDGGGFEVFFDGKSKGGDPDFKTGTFGNEKPVGAGRQHLGQAAKAPPTASASRSRAKSRPSRSSTRVWTKPRSRRSIRTGLQPPSRRLRRRPRRP